MDRIKSRLQGNTLTDSFRRDDATTTFTGLLISPLCCSLNPLATRSAQLCAVSRVMFVCTQASLDVTGAAAITDPAIPHARLHSRKTSIIPRCCADVIVEFGMR